MRTSIGFRADDRAADALTKRSFTPRRERSSTRSYRMYFTVILVSRKSERLIINWLIWKVDLRRDFSHSAD